MIGKVIKHDLRASGLLYGVGFLISLFIAVGTMLNRNTFYSENMLLRASILMTACIVCVAALVLLFLIHTALRYDRSMYGEEGYLTFTLPLSAPQLVLGKFAAAVIWALCVSAMCGLLLFSILYSVVSVDAADAFWREVAGLLRDPEVFYGLASTAGVMIVSLIENVALIFVAITIAYLPAIRRGNGILAVILYFGIGFVESKLMNAIPGFSEQGIEMALDAALAEGEMHFFGALGDLCSATMIWGVVFTALYLTVTIGLVRKFTALR